MQGYKHPLVELRKTKEDRNITGLNEIDFEKYPRAREGFKNICKTCYHCSRGEYQRAGFVYYCKKYMKLVLEGKVTKRCSGYECALDYTRF